METFSTKLRKITTEQTNIIKEMLTIIERIQDKQIQDFFFLIYLLFQKQMEYNVEMLEFNVIKFAEIYNGFDEFNDGMQEIIDKTVERFNVTDELIESIRQTTIIIMEKLGWLEE